MWENRTLATPASGATRMHTTTFTYCRPAPGLSASEQLAIASYLAAHGATYCPTRTALGAMRFPRRQPKRAPQYVRT